MSTTKIAVMPYEDYEAACNKIKTYSGKTEPIKSGDLVAEIEHISNPDAVDAYNRGYSDAECANPFYYATRLDNTMGGAVFPENYGAVIRVQRAPKLFCYIFNNCTNLKTAKFISDTKLTEEEGGINIGALFNIGSVAPALEWADFTEFETKFTSINMAFRRQQYLKSIFGVLDLSECTDAANAFYDCRALEDIEFVPNTIKIALEFNWCDVLSKASLTSIINGLSAETAELTVTLSQIAVNNAFETAEGLADGSASEEWLALIATKPNWTISLV